MKLPRLITRPRLKWTGPLMVVGLTPVMFWSNWHQVDYFYFVRDTHVALGVGVGRGDVHVSLDTRAGRPQSKARHAWFWSNTNDEIWELFGKPRINWIPRVGIETGQAHSFYSVALPFWLLMMLFAAPTAWLWYTDRRAKPWQCPNCLYDLRGLDGGGNGVCPECGTPTERKP